MTNLGEDKVGVCEVNFFFNVALSIRSNFLVFLDAYFQYPHPSNYTLNLPYTVRNYFSTKCCATL